METINLRKANAIQTEIRKAIASKNVSDTVSINEYTVSIVDTLEKAKEQYTTDVTRKVALGTALFNIRKNVSRANARVGISDMLADIELIDAKLALYTNISTKEVVKSLTEISARVEKLKTTAPSENRIYGDRYNTVETSVVEQGTIDSAKQNVKELKREKQALQEKLLALNVNTTITIDSEDAMILKEEGIL